MTENTFAKPFNKEDQLAMLSKMAIHRMNCKCSVGCQTCDQFSDFCDTHNIPYAPINKKKDGKTKKNKTNSSRTRF